MYVKCDFNICLLNKHQLRHFWISKPFWDGTSFNAMGHFAAAVDQIIQTKINIETIKSIQKNDNYKVIHLGVCQSLVLFSHREKLRYSLKNIKMFGR